MKGEEPLSALLRNKVMKRHLEELYNDLLDTQVLLIDLALDHPYLPELNRIKETKETLAAQEDWFFGVLYGREEKNEKEAVAKTGRVKDGKTEQQGAFRSRRQVCGVETKTW